MSGRVIYFDSNATTMMSAAGTSAMLSRVNMGNPSSGYRSAGIARDVIKQLREAVLRELGNLRGYTVAVTSGGSESNCTALRMIVEAYEEKLGTAPHVVVGATEHKSVLLMVESLVSRGRITATQIQPVNGFITPAAVAEAILPHTCLVAVMHANNETGAINSVREIGRVAHARSVPFICDTVQTFGKIAIDPRLDNIDILSISFHKIHGPPGIGALVIRDELLRGYDLQPSIFGTQNSGLRGGTENVPAIAGAIVGLRETTAGRREKAEAVLRVKKYIHAEISRRMPTCSYAVYQSSRASVPETEIVFISGCDGRHLAGTLLLSVVCRRRRVCNVSMREELEKRGIIVSVGSACNTSSKSASHVLYALGADELIRAGALRISLDSENNIAQAQIFVREFLLVVQAAVGKK